MAYVRRFRSTSLFEPATVLPAITASQPAWFLLWLGASAVITYSRFSYDVAYLKAPALVLYSTYCVGSLNLGTTPSRICTFLFTALYYLSLCTLSSYLYV